MPYAGLNDLNDISPIGQIYEVDITYPKELHDPHDLPFLPQNSIPAGSKVKKLMATLQSKKNYIVLQFNQSPWLAPYIALLTQRCEKKQQMTLRKTFKLLNNAVFGKTMESMRKRIKMEHSDRNFLGLYNTHTKPVLITLHIWTHIINKDTSCGQFYRDDNKNKELWDIAKGWDANK
ncbi:hypothetical protein AGLY_011009 [Aphis glycines]|uniref:DNA-directed DNA polymerase n=1 Tax=Aphis glycines TaxID=307491 RepID=A0A6G0TEG1_APHGL|nr:hypothetical protein AGLY_011009 [Aphis glycines]